MNQDNDSNIELEWFAGVDWAGEHHLACLVDATGRRVGERRVAHGGVGLGELCDWLIASTGAPAERIAVAIETSSGPVVEALLERGFIVYVVNPKQLDRFRDRFTLAGAKDDSLDGYVLADSLRTDRHLLRRLRLDDPLIIELREWSRMGEELKQERVRLANRMREQLWRYYPQMLKLSNPDEDWLLALWQLAPTPAKAARLRPSAVERLLKAHRIRRLGADEVIATLGAKPLYSAPGTTEAASAHIATLLPRLRLVNQQISATERRLDELCARLAEAQDAQPGQGCEQRDVAILRSLPGVGRIVLATLLAEAWQPLQRRDDHALRALGGAAPVTRRSGKSLVVLRRYACNKRLERALYHWARVASQHDPISRARYHALRQRGHSHGRALRTIADRLLAVACTLLQRQTPFDPDYKTSHAAAA
jgi:transposase